MRIAITGAASGIGAALRARLESTGHEVLGIDLGGSDVDADLAAADGRTAAADAVHAWAGDGLDGFVPCAGLGPQAPPDLLVRVNYFGAVVLCERLRPLLAQASAPAVVAISSNSASTVAPGAGAALIGACLAGDEEAAVAAADEPILAYAASKLALARWVRREAVTEAWVGAGIRLNAVAPGAVRTPLLQGGLDHEVLGDAIRTFPIPTGGFGSPDDVAGVVDLLLGPGGRFVCGAVWFVDGGSDALLRPDAL